MFGLRNKSLTKDIKSSRVREVDVDRYRINLKWPIIKVGCNSPCQVQSLFRVAILLQEHQYFGGAAHTPQGVVVVQKSLLIV